MMKNLSAYSANLLLYEKDEKLVYCQSDQLTYNLYYKKQKQNIIRFLKKLYLLTNISCDIFSLTAIAHSKHTEQKDLKHVNDRILHKLLVYAHKFSNKGL